MNIVFAGNPDIAVPSLEILSRRHTVKAVLTNCDSEAGRGMQECCTPVKTAAVALDVPVLQPSRLGSEVRTTIAALSPELLVVVAYGKIFGPKFLSLFPKGGVNLHPSLLPRHRGASPITQTILCGDTRFGITVQTLHLEMDSGDILAQRVYPLKGDETTGSLTEFAGEQGADLLLEVVDAIESGEVRGAPQDPALATYCTKIAKDDGMVRWTDSAERIERLVRAFSPWPKAYTEWNGKILYVLGAKPIDADARGEVGTVVGVDRREGILVQTGRGLLALTRLQVQAKKALGFQDFLNGNRTLLGSSLGRKE